MQSKHMKTILRPLAALELLFIFPAVLFMSALFFRSIQPTQLEPAHTAQRVVDWYAAQPHLGLWVLLLALPLAVFTIGSATLVRHYRSNPQFRESVLQLLGFARTQAAAFLIAGTTTIAAAILVIVAVHVLTD